MPYFRVGYQGITNSFATILRLRLRNSKLPLRVACDSEASIVGSFDLHALSTPPAFILDQDQILGKKIA